MNALIIVKHYNTNKKDRTTIFFIDVLYFTWYNTDKLIRITDEGSIKVTMHVDQSSPETKKAIKFKTSRLKETMDFFNQLGLFSISEAKSHRISYELGKIDFDIDKFPAIPTFLEIDVEFIEEEGYTVESLLEILGLQDNKIVVMGTEDMHKLYGVNYFEVYKVK